MAEATDAGAVPDDASFEALYDRLAEVTAALEAGDLPLERSIALYEEGMTLARRCQELLSTVEQRVERLREAFDVNGAPER